MIELQDILRNNKKTITTAESCTGGLVASMITKVSGSSDIFNGSIV
ncbi:CinA family protein, partial [Aliarcobacter butzleri]|nr:CinA family protein [Aliarcobacter butzleri]